MNLTPSQRKTEHFASIRTALAQSTDPVPAANRKPASRGNFGRRQTSFWSRFTDIPALGIPMNAQNAVSFWNIFHWRAPFWTCAKLIFIDRAL
jgi:hypothetical protein